jgi:hypothetical protein
MHRHQKLKAPDTRRQKVGAPQKLTQNASPFEDQTTAPPGTIGSYGFGVAGGDLYVSYIRVRMDMRYKNNIVPRTQPPLAVNVPFSITTEENTSTSIPFAYIYVDSSGIGHDTIYASTCSTTSPYQYAACPPNNTGPFRHFQIYIDNKYKDYNLYLSATFVLDVYDSKVKDIFYATNTVFYKTSYNNEYLITEDNTLTNVVMIFDHTTGIGSNNCDNAGRDKTCPPCNDFSKNYDSVGSIRAFNGGLCKSCPSVMFYGGN